MKIYIVKRTYTSIILEINSKEEYNIIILKSDNNNRVITLKSIKLIIKKVSLSESIFIRKYLYQKVSFYRNLKKKL